MTPSRAVTRSEAPGWPTAKACSRVQSAGSRASPRPISLSTIPISRLLSCWHCCRDEPFFPVDIGEPPSGEAFVPSAFVRADMRPPRGALILHPSGGRCRPRRRSTVTAREGCDIIRCDRSTSPLVQGAGRPFRSGPLASCRRRQGGWPWFPQETGREGFNMGLLDLFKGKFVDPTYPGVHAGGDIITTTLDAVVKWGRKSSLWPMPFGTACCAIEFMAVSFSHYDIARFGAEVLRFSPRQADLMFVAGTIVDKQGPILKTIYDQMPEPKWVISMGVCASSGGFYRSYHTMQGIDEIIPVDVYVPGCPPAPEALIVAL